MSCVLQRVLLPEDNSFEVFRKKVMLIVIAANLAYLALLPILHHNIVFVTALSSSAVMFIQLLVERRIRYKAVECWLYFSAPAVFSYDLMAMAVKSCRLWPAIIVVLDISLVLNMAPRVHRNLIIMFIIWLALASAEEWLRFGLIEAHFPSIPQEDRAEPCNCESGHPCRLKLSSALSTFGIGLLFLLDFYFTHGFARDLQKERQSMQNVITASERTAEYLSKFDLEAAASTLSDTPLPPPLHSAFDSILANLHVYRPYLPQSCFQLGCDESTGSEDGSQKSSDRHTCDRSLPETDNSLSLEEVQNYSLLEHLNFKKAVTYTVTNMLESHTAVENNIDSFTQTYRDFMTTVLQAVKTNGGVVGVVVGDHAHASFNAAKRCVSHGRKAADALMEVDGRLRVSSSLASGSAHCGPIGNSELKLFGIVGQVAVTATLLERYGRHCGHGVTCDLSVRNELAFVYEAKLVLSEVTVRGRDTPLRVFEVLRLPEMKLSQHDTEWLYQVSEDAWERYNAAGVMYLDGEWEGALKAADIPLHNGHHRHSVQAAVLSLKEAIVKEVPCPTTVL